MKKKAVFITNIPSPYRVDFFSYMQKNFPEYEFHIIFSGAAWKTGNGVLRWRRSNIIIS